MAVLNKEVFVTDMREVYTLLQQQVKLIEWVKKLLDESNAQGASIDELNTQIANINQVIQTELSNVMYVTTNVSSEETSKFVCDNQPAIIYYYDSNAKIVRLFTFSQVQYRGYNVYRYQTVPIMSVSGSNMNILSYYIEYWLYNDVYYATSPTESSYTVSSFPLTRYMTITDINTFAPTRTDMEGLEALFIQNYNYQGQKYYKIALFNSKSEYGPTGNPAGYTFTFYSGNTKYSIDTPVGAGNGTVTVTEDCFTSATQSKQFLRAKSTNMFNHIYYGNMVLTVNGTTDIIMSGMFLFNYDITTITIIEKNITDINLEIYCNPYPAYERDSDNSTLSFGVVFNAGNDWKYSNDNSKDISLGAYKVAGYSLIDFRTGSFLDV